MKDRIVEIIDNVLDETFESVSNLRTLAMDILSYVAVENLPLYDSAKGFSFLYGMKLSQIKSNGKDYGELNDFIEYLSMYIIFERFTNDNTHVRGEYARYSAIEKNRFNPALTRELTVRYHYEKLKAEIDRYYVEGATPLNASMLAALFYFTFYEALIHELQHAYDDFRSKGMTFNTKENAKFNKEYDVNSIDDVIANDVVRYKKYLNLPHEIWARFIQAVDKTHFAKVDFIPTGGVKRTMRDLREVTKELTTNLTGYQEMNADMKNRIIRKISQFWHFEKEKIEALNKK